MKFRFNSNCLVGKKPHYAGDTIELSMEADKDKIGMLYHANRIQLVEDEQEKQPQQFAKR